jgi:hypothetical protein
MYVQVQWRARVVWWAQTSVGYGCVYFGEALRSGKELDSLNLNILLLVANASNAPLDCAAYAPASGVASADTGSFGVGSDGWDDTGGFGMVHAPGGTVACGHLYAGVADSLVVLQGLLDGE